MLTGLHRKMYYFRVNDIGIVTAQNHSEMIAIPSSTCGNWGMAVQLSLPSHAEQSAS